MARRHWLDPLARQLLIAGGQLPRSTNAASRSPHDSATSTATAAAPSADDHDAVERELLALKLGLNPALPLRNAQEVGHAAALGWRLDVNRATPADWGRLPGCTPAHAHLLARLQAGGVQLSGPEDLRDVLALDATTLASWLPLLEFRWYGERPLPAATAPVAINQAPAAVLARLPGLSTERSQRLQRERARAPFRDLADLGARLCLPPELLERWIGRVAFAPGPAGPELPPAPPRSASPTQPRPGGMGPH
ncbi:MAG: hypothetical protein ACKOZT_03735 [Cyanobium sp.]